MNNDGIRRLTHGDDVVISRTAIRDEDDDRLAGVEPCLQVGRTACQLHGPPSAAPHGIDERTGGNAAGAPVDDRRELLGIRVNIAPVAKHHRGRRAAAQRIGLRQVRHVHRHRSGERQRGGQCGDHLMAMIRMMTSSRMMMIVVVEITTVDAPPTSCSLTVRAAFAACSRSVPASVSIAAAARDEIEVHRRGDVPNLWPRERLADCRAAGVLRGDPIGHCRRQLPRRDEVLHVREGGSRHRRNQHERKHEQLSDCAHLMSSIEVNATVIFKQARYR